MNNTDYLKISNDIKKDFRIQYIKNMYLALRIVIAVVGLAEITIALFYSYYSNNIKLHSVRYCKFF